MKKLTTIACVALLAACGQSDEGQKTEVEIALDSDKAKISYAIGLDIGESLQPIAEDLDKDVLIAAVNDRMSGKEPRLSNEQALEAKQAFSKKLGAKRVAEKKLESDKNIKDGDAFRAENGKRAEVTTTASGLQYEVLKQGDGPKPTATDSVSVYYKGTFVDGSVFDQSQKGETVNFPLNAVIAGWTEGLQLMNVGSRYKFVLPPELAYGETGSGPVGPSSTLIFEVELVSIGAEEK